MIQSFLILVDFGDICQFLFRDMGYFSKYLKGYGILGTPLPGPHELELRKYLLNQSSEPNSDVDSPIACGLLYDRRRGASAVYWL